MHVITHWGGWLKPESRHSVLPFEAAGLTTGSTTVTPSERGAECPSTKGCVPLIYINYPPGDCRSFRSGDS